ncbi:MAG: hypothetical protein AB7Q17_11100 [Phycisphaerae bacterium]
MRTLTYYGLGDPRSNAPPRAQRTAPRLRRLFAAVGALAVAGAAQAAELHLVFSAEDPFAGTGRTAPALPGDVAAVPGSGLNTPPVTNPTIPGGRLWVWGGGTPGDTTPNVWNGIAVNVVINGAATIVGGGMLNVTSPTEFRRWETGSDLTSPTFNLVAVTRRGLQLPAARDGFDDGSAWVLLGYLDFAANGGVSDVRFQVGAAGISRQDGSPSDCLRFGADDDCFPGPVPGNQLPDAFVVPEPAGAVLLIGAFAMSLRRRRTFWGN